MSAFSILFFVLNNYAVFLSNNFLDSYYKTAFGDMSFGTNANASTMSLIHQDCANFIAQPHPIGYRGFIIGHYNGFDGVNVSHGASELLTNVHLGFNGVNFSSPQLTQDLSFAYTLVAGAWPAQDNQIMISDVFASNNGITVGDYLTFENESASISHQFQVSGLLGPNQEYIGLYATADQDSIYVIGTLMPSFTLTFNLAEEESTFWLTSVNFFLNHNKIDYWLTLIANGELAVENNLFLQEFHDKSYIESDLGFTSSIGQASTNWEIMQGYNAVVIDFLFLLIPLGVIFFVLLSGQIRLYLTEEIDNIKSLMLNSYSPKKVRRYYIKEQLIFSGLVIAGSIGLSSVATTLAYSFSTQSYPLLTSGYLSVFGITTSSLLPWLACMILLLIYFRMFQGRMKSVLTQIEKSAMNTSFQYQSRYQKWRKVGKVLFIVLLIPVVQSVAEILMFPETRVALSYDLPYQILTGVGDSVKVLLPILGVVAFLTIFDKRIIAVLQSSLTKLVPKADEVGKLFVKRVTAQRTRNVLLLFFFVAFSVFFISALADQKYFEKESTRQEHLIQQGADAWLNLWHQDYSLTTSFFERINSTRKSLLHLIPCRGNMIQTEYGVEWIMLDHIVFVNYTEYSRSLRPDCPKGFLSQIQLVDTLQEYEILLPTGYKLDLHLNVGDKIKLSFNNKTEEAPTMLEYTIKGFFDYFAGIPSQMFFGAAEFICLAKDGPNTQQYYQNFTVIDQYYLVDFPFSDPEILALTKDGTDLEPMKSLIFNFTAQDLDKLNDEAYWVTIQNQDEAGIQSQLYSFLDLNVIGFTLFLAVLLLFFSRQFVQDLKLQLSRLKFGGYPGSSIRAHLAKIIGLTCLAGLIFGNIGFVTSYLLTRASGFDPFWTWYLYPVVSTFPIDKLIFLNLVFGGSIVILTLLLRRMFGKTTYGYELLRRQANE